MTTAPRNGARYDYIVVGSGAGGAPAAARLAEQGFKVLVLEQGADAPSKYADVPLLAGAASEDNAAGRYYFVQHFENRALALRDSKYDQTGQGIVYPRGTGRIGGSTQCNALVWVRADDDDWNHYAKVTGDDFWKAHNMRQLFQLVEKNRYRPVLRLLDALGRFFGIEALRNRRGHGFGGYIETTRASIGLLFKDSQLLKIALKTLGHSLRLGSISDKLKRLLTVFDPNDDRAQGTEGFAWTPLAVTKGGWRSGVRQRLLEVQNKHPENLEILTGAKVIDIELNDDCEATYVRYTLNGATHSERIGREVILAAGAFETPAILMRSGIGPEEEFEKLKKEEEFEKLKKEEEFEKLKKEGITIALKVSSPGVGRRLHDRYEISVISQMKRDFALLDGVSFKADMNDRHYAEWLQSGGGIYATNGVAVAFQMKSDRELPDPDLYIFCLPCSFRGYERDYFPKTVRRKDMCTWLVLHENKGDSDGTVALDPKNIAGDPKINFRYHTEDPANPNDSQPLVVGVKVVRKLIASYSDIVHKEAWPGADVQGDAALRAEIESDTWGHHANGTARMGKAGDHNAVVDGDLKVIGAKRIRIADASVFPRSPGSFIVSAIVQVGEAAAIKAIAEACSLDPLAVKNALLQGQRVATPSPTSAMSPRDYCPVR